MDPSVFKRKIRIPAPVESAFAWHARPGAIQRLSPPWDPLTIIRQSGGILPGAEVVMKMNAGPVKFTWVARHTDYEENRFFVDTQIKGPFAEWTHTHRFEPESDIACFLEDEIRYALPLHPAGTLLGDFMVRKKLNRIFTYRHATTVADIDLHRSLNIEKPMSFLISGTHGMIGSNLMPFLSTGGHRPFSLVRQPPEPGRDEIFWDPANGRIDIDDTQEIDAVIHLAGENIAQGRWTTEKKRRIMESRTRGTALIAQTIAKMKRKPKVFICASAIGYYGDRKEALMSEADPPGKDFISEVCTNWEASANAAVDAGVRTVFLRLGIVLSPLGGALQRLLPVFQAGIGGRIGSGNQYMSWISLDDVLGAILHLVAKPDISGPVNLVAPHPVTNKEFTKTLGEVLSRPAALFVPEAAITAVYGRMGKETILSGTRVSPAKLMESGYRFRHTQLKYALAHVLGKN